MAVLEKYKGVFPAFYACYDEHGEISRERSAELARFYCSVGIRGLYVGGSSGECVYLTADERKATLEAVMEAVGGKMTIIAHIAAPSTRESIELALHAEKLGVDAIAMVPGFYYKPKDEMVYKYWCDVIDATDSVPLFIYNIPGTTNGFNLSTPIFEKLLATGRVAGVKNSSPSVLDIMRFRMAGGEDVAIFTGVDEQYLAGRMMGASGGIGTTYGFMPELFLRLENLIEENDMEDAMALQQEITGIIFDALRTPSLYGASKAILKLRGLDVGSVRAPFLPITEDNLPAIETVYQRIQAAMERFL